ncbi:hypothetical protein NHF50_10110 [Flavobacterium sp. NRK F10]|uniref:hypothetical protein n=1 Tax=Flavobacterium sp. NRK F10 TaxID=2954931 RepID=UPI0020913CAE|nr:hypothetical protein [Flavobacterium sp. NRK F10]MCO6175397.1 hypothetical protein [Flavobacterium sp. NRK F10]
MKKILKITCKTVLPLFFTALFANEAKAQLKSYGTIGSALVGENVFLDVSENTVNYPNNRGRGLSFPRTDLTIWTFITGNLDGLSFPTAFDGMIVYNSGTGTTLAGQGIQTSVTPGFYYFYNPGATDNITNGQWVRLSSGDSVNVVSTDGGNIITVGTDGGAFIDAAAVATIETLTTLVDNTDGTYTYTSENATATTIDVPGSVINNASTIFGDTNVLNEISTAVATAETLTSLVDNGNGTITYTDEDGVGTVINLSTAVAAVETLTSLVDNGNGTITYTDEDGVATVLDMATLINLNTTVSNALTGTSLTTTVNGVTGSPLDLAALTGEPWFVQGGVVPATTDAEAIYHTGNVAIGQNAMFGSPGEKLAVAGTIRTTSSVYADYVFEDYFTGSSIIKKDYKFKTLNEVEAYIKENSHLPGVTSIKDLPKTKDGYSFNLTDLSVQSLEKLEELYLHVIEQQKQIEAKDKEMEVLKENFKTTNERLEQLEELLKVNNH